MKHILLILKEPFLDRIPSLKTLIMFLANNYKISIITSESENFTVNTFNHLNIKFIKTKEKTKKCELPTSVKILSRTLFFLLTHRIHYVIGGDAIGNIVAAKIARFIKKKHIFFMLEFPQVITDSNSSLTKLEIAENKALMTSDIIITHDKWHKKFICDNFKISSSKILILPNASLTPEYRGKNNILKTKLNIGEDNIIILHSGGFGSWFKCKELADSTVNWDNNIKLVFHLSHKMHGNKYFDSIFRTDYKNKVLFSLEPAQTYELDNLIASADIGIALYSEKNLGYRATYMGLASGKIGNYLKCGLPVIATRLESLSYIEEYECGVLIDNECDIINAIHKILSQYDRYSSNSHKCYRELWYPQPYLEQINKSLES